MRYFIFNCLGFAGLAAMFMVADILVLDISHSARSALGTSAQVSVPDQPATIQITTLN
ncbi:hypothetical protein [Algirhabdus cladophorae]|uniref:hypothetical protein n=1 Tax=Algirhabdus cladophorae TaxID=3377108 RepID=UPI003B84B292